MLVSVPRRNPDWGLPDIDVLRQLAYGNGMRMERIVSHMSRLEGNSTNNAPFTSLTFPSFRLRWRNTTNASSSGNFKEDRLHTKDLYVYKRQFKPLIHTEIWLCDNEC